MREVVVVAAVRTAIGRYGGSLKDVSAVDLGVGVVKGALEKIDLKPNQVDEVIFGNVLGAGLGQNIARQISIRSGIPTSRPAYTVNKVCGSGLKSVQLAMQAILLGDAELVVAGGTENMSQAAHILPQQRWGSRLGHTQVLDTLLLDGLTDAFDGKHMGMTAEHLAKTYHITREEQDTFALQSQKKAQKALSSGRFKDEIVPITISLKKGESCIVDTDEHPRGEVKLEDLAKLRPAFKSDGSVTAGNASGINDGAAVLVLASRDKAEHLGLPILASLKAYASAGVDPKVMGCGPIVATQKLLDKLGLGVSDIDLVESNEAFAAQACTVTKELGLDPDVVNVNGGAIALGHPIGASGARILVTLIHELNKRDLHTGLATLCIGGGMGMSLLVTRR